MREHVKLLQFVTGCPMSLCRDSVTWSIRHSQEVSGNADGLDLDVCIAYLGSHSIPVATVGLSKIERIKKFYKKNACVELEASAQLEDEL